MVTPRPGSSARIACNERTGALTAIRIPAGFVRIASLNNSLPVARL